MNKNDFLTSKFWNKNPCDGQSDFYHSRYFRYSKEPWLVNYIHKIAQLHSELLEIGCGQGVDSYEFATSNQELKITSLDLSLESILIAKKHISFSENKPLFMVGNALDLPFSTESFEAIYSMGVLHHTSNINTCLNEIFRVLKTNGNAYIILYKTTSIKLLTAHFFRLVQRITDVFFGKNSLLKIARKYNHLVESRLGTALLECFGTPILNSYTKNQIISMFNRFHIETIESFNSNIFNNSDSSTSPRPLGYLWFIKVSKLN